MNHGSNEDHPSTNPINPVARPNPFIDRLVVFLTIVLLGVLTFIGLYFG
jgi:hypothetical protein